MTYAVRICSSCRRQTPGRMASVALAILLFVLAASAVGFYRAGYRLYFERSNLDQERLEALLEIGANSAPKDWSAINNRWALVNRRRAHSVHFRAAIPASFGLPNSSTVLDDYWIGWWHTSE